MKNWLVALQTPYDMIKHITNLDDNFAYTEYYAFFQKIKDIRVLDPNGFRECLKEIGRAVALDTDTGEWIKQPIGVDIDHTMEELIKYNGLDIPDDEVLTKSDIFRNLIQKVVRSKNGRDKYK